MDNQAEIAMIKKRLGEVMKKQVALENQIDKQEEDGNYDDALYAQLDKLEEERNNLQMQLEGLGE